MSLDDALVDIVREQSRLRRDMDRLAAGGVVPVGARTNLLDNGGFELETRAQDNYNSYGQYSLDRWQIFASGFSPTISKVATPVDIGSSGAAQVVYTHVTGGYTNFTQALSDALQLRGRTVTLSGRVRISAPGTVYLRILLDLTTVLVSSPILSEVGTYQTLVCSGPIPAFTTRIDVQTIITGASMVTYLDNFMLVVGPTPADYVPLAPAEELARCQRTFYSTFAGFPTSGVTGLVIGIAASPSLLLLISGGDFPTTMRATPTIAVSNNGVANTVRNTLTNATVSFTPASIRVSPSGLQWITTTSSVFTTGAYYDFDYTATAEL